MKTLIKNVNVFDGKHAELTKNARIIITDNLVTEITTECSGEDGFDRVNPSILKATIQSDYPNFDERAIGFKRFSDMMKKLEKEGLVVVEMDEAHTMLLKIC